MKSSNAQIIEKLSEHIDPGLVKSLLSGYEKLLDNYGVEDSNGVLHEAGRLVEHTFQIIQYLRNGKILSKIKNVSAIKKDIENDEKLSNSMRFIIPESAYGIWAIINKRDGKHVNKNEVSPTRNDSSLIVNVASWIIAEFVRLFYDPNESKVQDCMQILMQPKIPLIEKINGETIVTKNLSAINEVLLLINSAGDDGMSREGIGASAKCSPSSISHSLKKLLKERYIHQTKDKIFRITSTGRNVLANIKSK